MPLKVLKNVIKSISKAMQLKVSIKQFPSKCTQKTMPLKVSRKLMERNTIKSIQKSMSLKVSKKCH